MLSVEFCQNPVFSLIGATWTTSQTFPAGNYTFRFIASPALLGPGIGPVLPEAAKHVTRKIDLDRLQPLLDELKKKAEQTAS